VYFNVNVAIYAVFVLLLMNLILAVVIYGLKMRNIRYRKVCEQFNIKFKDYLHYIQANIDSDEPLRIPPVKLTLIEEKALQDRLNDLIETFKGEQRFKLMDLCEELGFVSTHMDRLKGGSYRQKIDAAYHLGCMRSGMAVPLLLGLLKDQKHDSSLFIIARAIAKCARQKQDIKQMVHILLSHKKNLHDLIADMIEESEVDHVELFHEWIHKEDPALIHIGLTGLKDLSDPTAVSAVRRLIDSKDPQIQRKAITIYLNSNILLPKGVVTRLLNHESVDIRLLTVRKVSELKNSAYADVLKKSLLDSDRRVIDAGVTGLSNLGEEGMMALCEGAYACKEKEQGRYIHDLITEEINRLSTELHDVNQLARYNTLKYFYEKTFGQRRIYRVV